METEAQMSATGTSDDNVTQNGGNDKPVISQDEVLNEVAKRDNVETAKPQPQAQESSNPGWDKALQKVQQDLSSQRRDQDGLSQQISAIQQSMTTLAQAVSALATAQQAQPQQQQSESKPTVDLESQIREAWTDADPLDGESLQDAMVNSLKVFQQATPAGDNGQMTSALQDLASRVESLQNDVHQNKVESYWTQIETDKNVSTSQRQQAQADAFQDVKQKGWYAENSAEFSGAVHAETMRRLDAGQSTTSNSNAQVAGTDVIPPGATARTTNSTRSASDDVVSVTDSDLWVDE